MKILARPPPPFLRQASGQIDDVNVFSSTSDIFSWMTPHTPNHPRCLALYALSLPYLMWYFLTVLQYNSPIILVLSCQLDTWSYISLLSRHMQSWSFLHNTVKIEGGKNIDRIWLKFWYEKLLPRIVYDINICVFPHICKTVSQYMNLLTNLIPFSWTVKLPQFLF
jgi:hypothetical protein